MVPYEVLFSSSDSAELNRWCLLSLLWILNYFLTPQSIFVMSTAELGETASELEVPHCCSTYSWDAAVLLGFFSLNP